MILMILFFQGLRGYDPLMASILITPMAIGLIIAGPLGGNLSDKYGSRLISTGGLVLSLVGLVGLSMMQYDTTYRVLAVWMFVHGFGSGLFQPPNTSAIMASVPLKRRGVASSMRSFLSNAGMVISMTLALPLLLNTIPLDDEHVRCGRYEHAHRYTDHVHHRDCICFLHLIGAHGPGDHCFGNAGE
jgi:MFS family permease